MEEESHPNSEGKCSLIPLDSDQGKTLLQESNYTDLVPHFCKQVCLTFCGFCSIAVSVNGLLEKLDSSSKFKNEILQFQSERNTDRFDEDSVFEYKGVKDILQVEQLKTEGITLDHLGNVVASLGLKPTAYFAEKNERSGCALHKTVRNVDEFRSVVLEAMSKPFHHVVSNYYMGDLGLSANFGHFSPLGGYHSMEDRFLVLDVWPSTPVAWVKAEDLFNAMISVDSQSGKSRGICVISLEN